MAFTEPTCARSSRTKFRTSGFRGEAIVLEVAKSKKVAPIALATSIEFAHNEECVLLFCEGLPTRKYRTSGYRPQATDLFG